MKKPLQVLVACFLIATSKAQIIDSTIDDPGDIAFVAYHSNPDGFSFVFLDHCPDGTSIRFVDEEWDGASFVSANTEGEVLWTNDTGQTLSQGTVIHIENANDNAPGIAASQGNAVEDNGGFSLDLTDDGILAITGTRSIPGNFLSFFGDSTDSSLFGTSLSNGTTANQDASYGAGYYSGVSNCTGITIEDCGRRLNSKSNWTLADSFNYPALAINSLDVQGVLSVHVSEQKHLVKISPNPVKDDLIIFFKEAPIKIRIYTLLGQKLSEVSLLSNTSRIPVRFLPKGIYFLEIDFQDFRIVEKFIKK
jgi:hypothetical protein